jgi:YD repeat-containing protein
MKKQIIFLAAVGICTSASAAETISYSYDALGRLVETKVVSGTVANTDTKVVYDAAGNRKSYVVTGASK